VSRTVPVPVHVAFALAFVLACASYTGTARDVSPAVLDDDPGWVAVRDVPYLAQQSDADCGAAAIAMVASYWTGVAAHELAAALRPVPARGIKAGRLREFARGRGLASFLITGELDDLAHELSRGRPVLVGLVKPQRKNTLDHYEVVVGLHRARGVVISLDPAAGWRRNTIEGFLAEWQPAGRLTLIVSAASPAALRPRIFVPRGHEHQDRPRSFSSLHPIGADDDLPLVREPDPDRDLAGVIHGHRIEREIDDRGAEQGIADRKQSIGARVESSIDAELPSPRRGIEDHRPGIVVQSATKALERVICFDHGPDLALGHGIDARASCFEGRAEHDRSRIIDTGK
jgi:hypothetical protein